MRTFLPKLYTVFIILLLAGFLNIKPMAAGNAYTHIPYTSFETTNGLVKCYPNPAMSYINFEFGALQTGQKYRLAIYNFTGKKMSDIPVTATTVRVDLTTFFRGIYMYQLINVTGKPVDNGKFQVIK